MYDLRNHIEIEKKYNVNDKIIFEKVLEELEKWEESYEISEPTLVEQEDYYFDTANNKLFNENITLRVRNKKGNKILTIKTPTKESNDRFEYEKEIGNTDLFANKNFILRYIRDLTEEDINNLKEKIIIKNNRNKVDIVKNKVKFEMVFDDVTYVNKDNNKDYHEYQIEIELKSDYPHRINLNLLGNYLEDKIKGLEPINDSKYSRALGFTKED